MSLTSIASRSPGIRTLCRTPVPTDEHERASGSMSVVSPPKTHAP